MEDGIGEALRAAERVLDHQSESLLSERGDLERLMRLGIAALAGALAGTGLLVQVGILIPLLAVVSLATGVLMQATATAMASGAAPPSDMSMGPEPVDLYRSVDEGQASLQDVRLALLDHAVLAHRHNLRSLERIARRRGAVSLLLFTGAGAVLLGMSYVVGGAILG